jgi:hypothetical protein
MAWLKVTMIFLLIGTTVALFAGVVELTVGSEFTVNAWALVVLPELVTVTFRAPLAAFAVTANVAVICVLLTTVVLLTVIPVPLRPIVAPIAKLVPVSVTDMLCPWMALFGLIEVSVGAEALYFPPHPERKMLSRNAIPRRRDHILLTLLSFICALFLVTWCFFPGEFSPVN